MFDKMKPMDTPSTREEFEYRFHRLRELINRDKFSVAHGIETGLEHVRFLPNGRIDFLSVNESARLNANMTIQQDGVDIENITDQ